MSKALDYLMHVRGETMANYFAFLKEAGNGLDDKTRDIISIITKVDNQTEKGFKQYLKRALADGVTAAEIIDALLFAFPSLGLTKIIWAMDIIIEMDLPEFNPEQFQVKQDWCFVTDIDEVSEGLNFYVLEEVACFVFKRDEVLSVYSNICPHQSNPMDLSQYQLGKLICPYHAWEFEIEQGTCLEKSGKSLQQYEFKVEDEKLFILV